MGNSEQEFDAEIDRLVALQTFDRELKGRVDRVDELSGAADAFQSKVDRQRKIVAELDEQRAALEKQRAEMDERLEIDGSRMRDNRMRMSRVRNDKELLALQREIDLGKESKQQIEEQMLAVMESLEAIQSQLVGEQEQLDGLEEQVAAEIEERRAEAETLSVGLDDEKAKREDLASAIESSLRSRYETIFSRRAGTAVVEAKRGICTGCHMNLQPQLFNELQRNREVRQCPNCHRILYFRAKTEEE